jgi:CheY-like chemotaxis protein
MVTAVRSTHFSSYSPEASPPVEPFSITTEQKAAIRILVVDDDRTLREGCASALQIDGYNVTTAARGDEAIELVRRRKFDIVLVDLFMTPVPGAEILASTLEANKDTIVVMMTGDPTVATSIETLRAGRTRDQGTAQPRPHRAREQRSHSLAGRVALFPPGRRARAQSSGYGRLGDDQRRERHR